MSLDETRPLPQNPTPTVPSYQHTRHCVYLCERSPAANTLIDWLGELSRHIGKKRQPCWKNGGHVGKMVAMLEKVVAILEKVVAMLEKMAAIWKKQ